MTTDATDTGGVQLYTDNIAALLDAPVSVAAQLAVCDRALLAAQALADDLPTRDALKAMAALRGALGELTVIVRDLQDEHAALIDRLIERGIEE